MNEWLGANSGRQVAHSYTSGCMGGWGGGGGGVAPFGSMAHLCGGEVSPKCYQGMTGSHRLRRKYLTTTGDVKLSDDFLARASLPSFRLEADNDEEGGGGDQRSTG